MLKSHNPHSFWQEWKSKPHKILEYVCRYARSLFWRKPKYGPNKKSTSDIVCRSFELTWKRFIRMATKLHEALGLSMAKPGVGLHTYFQGLMASQAITALQILPCT